MRTSRTFITLALAAAATLGTLGCDGSRMSGASGQLTPGDGGGQPALDGRGGADAPDGVAGADDGSTFGGDARPDTPRPTDTAPADPGPGLDAGGPQLCCERNRDCANGWTCVRNAGVCKPLSALTDATCWTQGDCSDGAECIGARVCPCGADCDQVDAPGRCTTDLPPDCCASREDCPAGYGCLRDERVCKAFDGLGAGQCWTDEMCGPNASCVGAFACPCDADCDAEDQPGQCVPDPVEGNCCAEDGACRGSEACVLEPFVCKGRNVPPGRCWGDAWCPDDVSCVDARVCPCGAPCDAPDRAGFCQDEPPPPPLCCQLDQDCGPGFDCAEGAWTCKARGDLEAGQCWSDDTCPDGQECFEANICPCGADCDMESDVPGKCSGGDPGGCCGDAGACPPNAYCHADARVCKEVPPDGGCWGAADCPAGTTCDGAFVCPCGALCGPLGDRMGKCVPDDPTPAGCCSSSGMCPALGQACVPDSGVCKSRNGLEPGQCWADAWCGPGETCEGAAVCPCGAACLFPDQPGKCTTSGSGGSCMALNPGGFGACLALIGWVYDGRDCVYTSGCGCGEYCDHVYDTQKQCLEACDLGPGECAMVDASSFGPCDMVLGWVFDGTSCRNASGCGCDTRCHLVFDSMEGCAADCASDSTAP